MHTNWLTLIWYGGAAVFGLLGLFLLMRWLIGDRSKGRRRCPKCWYDMSATSGLQCPECGKTAKRESLLHRRRRSRKTCIIAIVALVLSGMCGIWPSVLRNDWPKLIPTSVLMMIVHDGPKTICPQSATLTPILPITHSPTFITLQRELGRRYSSGHLPRWQRGLIAKRDIPDSKNPDFVLIVPKSIGQSDALPFFIPDELSLCFARSMASNGGRRELWVESLSPRSTIKILQDDLYAHNARTRGGLPTIAIDSEMPTLGRHTFTFRVRLFECFDRNGDKLKLLDAIVRRDIDVVASPMNGMIFVDDAQTDKAIVNALTLNIVKDNNYPEFIEITLDASTGIPRMLEFNFDVELLHDGVVVANRAAYVPQGSTNGRQFAASLRSKEVNEFIDQVRSTKQVPDTWHLRIKARPFAFPNNGNFSWWAGDFEVPITEILRELPEWAK